MKKAVKALFDIFRILLSVFLFVGIFYHAYDYLNEVFVSDVDTNESFHDMPENSLDVLVLGSSHAEYSFVPSFFYEDTGLYSYVLGSACQPLEVSYEMLKEALKTQSPKLVILEAFTATPLRSICEADSCYVLASYKMRKEERIATLNYLEKEKAETYYNDFLTNHNQWKEMNSLKDLLKEEKESFIDSDFGYVYQDGVEYYPENWWRVVVPEVQEERSLEAEDEEALNAIYELCKEKGIALFLYKTPNDSMTSDDMAVLDALWKWADEREVAYVDFFDIADELNYYINMHSDSFHAYISGASILTDHLAKTINGLEYGFDHKENKALTPLYVHNGIDYTAKVLQYEHDPHQYSSRLKNADGYLLIRYNPYYTKNKMKIGKYIKELGVQSDIFDNSTYYNAIIKDGEILFESNYFFDEVVDGVSVSMDELGATIGDTYQAYGECNLSLLYLDEDLTLRFTKNINTKTDWDYGWSSYKY